MTITVHAIGASKVAEKQSEVPFAVRNFPALPDDAGLTADESIAILGIGKSTFWAWAAAGRIKLRRLGRTTRATAGELRRVIAGAR